jgi:hypothetical protein
MGVISKSSISHCGPENSSRWAGVIRISINAEQDQTTQRIMAIPLKRFARPLLGFLSQSEMQALLQAMDNSWSGRRDHLLFLFLYNTDQGAADERF